MMFRKSFLILLGVPLVLLLALYFARNVIVRAGAESAVSALLATEVTLQGVDFDPFAMTVRVEGLRVLDAEQPSHDLVVAGPLVLNLNGAQLAAGKFVLEEVRAEGVRINVLRPEGPVPGWPRPVEDTAAAEAPGFSLDLPSLNTDALSASFDLKGASEGQPRRAGAILAEAGAARDARLKDWRARRAEARLEERLADLEHEVAALKQPVGADVGQIRAFLARLDGLKTGNTALRTDAAALSQALAAEPGIVGSDLARANAALDADLADMLSSAGLVGLDTGRMGELLFGPGVVEHLRTAMVWLQRARAMVSSDAQHGAVRAPAGGRIVTFPTQSRVYPRFLIERAEFSGWSQGKRGGSTEDGPGVAMRGSLSNLGSNARLLAEPARLEVSAGGSGTETWSLLAVLDHRQTPGRDLLESRTQGARLNDLRLGGGMLPESVSLAPAGVFWQVELSGNALAARLEIDAAEARFRYGKAQTPLPAVAAVFETPRRLTLRAALSGPLTSPRLSATSSMDGALAGTLQGLLGARQAEAEARARALLRDRLESQSRSVLGTGSGTGSGSGLQADGAGLAADREGLTQVEGRQQALSQRLAGLRQEAEAALTPKIPSVKIPPVQSPSANDAARRAREALRKR